MDFAKLLPMAIVMVAGPQVLSAIFLATSENWRRNSAAYVLGASLSITTVGAIAFLLGGGASDRGASDDALYIVVLILLFAAGAHVYMARETAEPPKWMGRLQTATPGLSLRLGFLLLGVFPTDILTSVAMGTYLASKHDTFWHFLPFLALTLLILATPGLLVAALGERGKVLLPKVRDWMNDNSWIVNEAVIGLFILLTISDLA
jgi:hypothetical protein